MLRTCVLGCALTGVLALGIGCTKTTEKTTEKTAAKTKEEAVAVYKVRLGEADKELATLKEKAAKATGDDKAKLEAKWKASEAKRDAAKKKLEELEKSAADKWEAVNKEAASAFDDMKKAMNE